MISKALICDLKKNYGDIINSISLLRRSKCRRGQCAGLNEKKNTYNAARHFMQVCSTVVSHKVSSLAHQAMGHSIELLS